MFVRQDNRGYFRLVTTIPDPKTGKPRRREYYLGKEPKITWAKAKKLELDREQLAALALSGKLILLSEEIKLRVALTHNGYQWTAVLKSNHPLTDKHPILRKSQAKTLKALTRNMQEAILKIESESGIDSGIQFRVDFHVPPGLEIPALKELRMRLYELNQPPFHLLLPPATPIPKVLDTSQALSYLKKTYNLKRTPEALYNAIRRGRLSPMLGAWKHGSFSAALVAPGDPLPWNKPPGHKRWPALGFLKKDLDKYVKSLHRPKRNPGKGERRDG